MIRKIITNHQYRKTKTLMRMFASSQLTLFGDEASPPVRFVQMTAALLEVPVNFHKVDLFQGEHKSDFYKKINPLQKVPALIVGNMTIVDSHAIALYLCENSKDRTLYPEDPAVRSIVQQMLFFNSSTLFPIDSSIYTEYFAKKVISEKNLKDWKGALDYLELKLDQDIWLAGEKMTLCDLCCGATVSSLGILLPLNEKHTRVKAWIEKLKELPCNVINARGLDRLQHFVDLNH